MSADKDSKCFHAWRRSEAYAIPMTEAGMKAAEERYREFKKGFDCGIKSCMLELEKEHSKNKKIHSFFLISKNLLEKMLKD